MIIDCIGCLHGHYPKLDGGDLLIITGDLTRTHTVEEFQDFYRWAEEQDYKKKVLIAGNHDSYLFQVYNLKIQSCLSQAVDYLCDSGTEFDGLKIWGSPWTKTFEGMNPHCKAFTCDTDKELCAKWALIPNDTDILITHGPPFLVLDRTVDDRRVGCPELRRRLQQIRPKLHACSHIHEDYGRMEYEGRHWVNCSHMNEHYKPVNPPIRVIL